MVEQGAWFCRRHARRQALHDIPCLRERISDARASDPAARTGAEGRVAEAEGRRHILAFACCEKVWGIGDFVWQTCRENDIRERFDIKPGKIVMKSKGKSPAEGSPLLARTSAHKYEIEACLTLKGEGASAGLVAYYDERFHFGYGFSRDGLLRYRRGQVSRAVSKCSEACQTGRLWLRMRSDHDVLSAWYSADGKTWHKFPWGFEVSGVHHNTVYGFLSLRPGLYAGGDGEVEVTDFKLTVTD